MLASLQDAARHHQVELQVAVQPRLTVWADPCALRQMLAGMRRAPSNAPRAAGSWSARHGMAAACRSASSMMVPPPIPRIWRARCARSSSARRCKAAHSRSSATSRAAPAWCCECRGQACPTRSRPRKTTRRTNRPCVTHPGPAGDQRLVDSIGSHARPASDGHPKGPTRRQKTTQAERTRHARMATPARRRNISRAVSHSPALAARSMPRGTSSKPTCCGRIIPPP